jgi:tetratricopeptide (TPR) repeat protein
MKNFEQALESYQKCIELDPRNIIYYSSKANTQFYLKLYEESIECLNKAIELNPNNQIYYQLSKKFINIIINFKFYYYYV